jgi:hypothetical protein
LCDVDVNDYSLKFCGARQIPSFAAIVQGRQLPPYTNADHVAVCKWLSTLPTVPAKPGTVGPEIKPPTNAVVRPPINVLEAPMPPEKKVEPKNCFYKKYLKRGKVEQKTDFLKIIYTFSHLKRPL